MCHDVLCLFSNKLLFITGRAGQPSTLKEQKLNKLTFNSFWPVIYIIREVDTELFPTSGFQNSFFRRKQLQEWILWDQVAPSIDRRKIQEHKMVRMMRYVYLSSDDRPYLLPDHSSWIWLIFNFLSFLSENMQNSLGDLSREKYKSHPFLKSHHSLTPFSNDPF